MSCPFGAATFCRTGCSISRGRIKGIDPQLTRVLVPWVMGHRRYLPGFLRLARTVAQSSRVRARWLARGVRVPPFLVLSVTSKCNLRCAGCYAGAVGTVTNAPVQPGLGMSEWRGVVDEAVRLGVMAFMIAGGEPFLLPDIAKLFRDYPDRLFLVFTNGTALRPGDYEILSRSTNTVVVVSLEGDRDLTDLRRGRGVFEKAMGSLDRLRKAGILTGIAVTIGSANVEYWSQPKNIDALIAHSGPLAMFIEQIPTGGCENGAVLTDEQRVRFRQVVVEYRDRHDGRRIHHPLAWGRRSARWLRVRRARVCACESERRCDGMPRFRAGDAQPEEVESRRSAGQPPVRDDPGKWPPARNGGPSVRAVGPR